MSRPPRTATLLMRVLLPAEPFEAIAGDLDEAWAADSHPSRLRYWRLALQSIAAYHRDRLRPAPPVSVFDDDHIEGDGHMRSLLQDLGYGVRLLRRTPGFTAAAIATLALGIGANTAIFSLVNVLSIKPLAYDRPSRVAFVLGWNAERQDTVFSMSYADFADLRQRARSLADVAAYTYWSANLTGGDIPERVQAYRVTDNTLSLLGVTPLLGRGFLPEEGRPGARRVVVISYGLWQRRFGGDPSVIGRQVQVDGLSHTLIGVMPARFEYPVFNFKGDLWAPLQLDATALNDRGSSNATVVARLRDGVSYAKAQADVDTIMRGLAAEHPATNRALGTRLVEMGKLDDEKAGSAMLIVMVTVSVVLLLACANVANLLLARGVTRQRELAVRAALGAGRWRIARQLLVESLVLAVGGGIAGTGLAFLALDAMRRALPDVVLTTQPNIDQLGIDAATLAFTLALSIVTSLLFGLVPAWKASRPALQDGLKESAAAGGTPGTRRLRSTLVVVEVALATVLLVSAGLLVRSYQNLQRLTPGFDADRVLTMTVSLPQYRYADAAARRLFFDHAVERIARLPGVRSAAFVNVLPFSTYNRGTRFLVDGQALPEAGREPKADYRVVTPEYFATLAIPIVAGRSFTAADSETAAPVAIVNRTLARQFFAGRDPIGERIHPGTSPDAPLVTIVGVVGDVHHEELSVAASPELYRPFAQAPAAMMMLAARVDGDPESLSQAARAEIQAVDRDQPVFRVTTLRRLVSDSLAAQTSAAAMVTLFSALALILAAVGIYGVLSYAVSQQAREFGVRMALGAQPADVLQLVLRRGLALVFGGLAAGIVVAAGLTRLMADALFGIGATDPLTYAGVAGILGVVGAIACGVPAWRATRVEPVVALRNP